MRTLICVARIYGEAPRNTKTRLRGGPVSRQAGEISLVGTSILPEIAIRIKTPFRGLMLLAQNQPSPGAVDVFDPKEESCLHFACPYPYPASA
jgi:hypothetical protein